MDGRPTRIAHLSNIASVGSTLVDALRSTGVDADLIDPIRPGKDLRYPWKAAVLPLRAAGLLSAAATVRRGRYDLVHVHYARLGLLGPLAGRPYLVHCHGSDVRGVAPGSAWGAVVGPPLRHAARVLYATPDLAPWVAAFRPDARFLPNPIVLRTVAPSPERRDLLVGVRLDPLKGADAIRETISAIRALRPNTTITVIAQGREVDAVRAAAGPAAQVLLPVDHSEMPALMARHRAALGQVGLGVVGNYELEALGAGLATAATFRFPDAYPSPPPFIDAGSPTATAQRLVALLEDEAALRATGDAGRRWVAANHDARAVARSLADLYAELLGDHVRPA